MALVVDFHAVRASGISPPVKRRAPASLLLSTLVGPQILGTDVAGVVVAADPSSKV